MAEEARRVEQFLKYLKEFLANIRPDDPLPVRAPSYKVTENEIDGQILDIVHHYLNGKDCPVFVRSYVAHKVWEHMRQPTVQSCTDTGSDGCSDMGDDDDDSDSDVDQIDATAASADTPVNSTYEAMKLIKEVTNKANDVIREMSNTFTPEKVANTPHYLPVSSFAIKNTRRKMEDRHIILRDLNTLYDMEYGEPHAFYGVFDGHAGSDAAVYTAAHLHQYLIQNPLYHIDPLAALKHAFHFADTNFLKKAKKERLKGGTTAVVALLREKRLAVAWLGDSLAVLVRKRKPVKLVEPHKPDRKSERDRVTNMGGCVMKLEGSWRILGQLAVSRAIGDADYKPYISSECDIKSLEIVGDEDFLILATDGLWDTISYDEAVSFVYAYLTINQGDCEGVGRCLVEQARRQGSQDNITAVVVFLRPVNTLMEEEAVRRQQGEIPESEMDPSWVMKKDAAPSTIYEIFSNNVGTFNPDSPSNKQAGDYNPFSPNASGAAPPPDMENGGNGQAAVVPTSHFSAYGQAAGDEYDLSIGLPVSNTPDPTMEDVESALAELDSLPDGEMDPSPEERYVNRHEGTDSNARLYDYDTGMDAEHEKQASNFLEQETFQQQIHITETESYKTESVPVPGSPAAQNGEDYGSHKSGSSPPSSPRSVEGFVTSVELNTAQEQLTTVGGFIGSDGTVPVEQQSGPFSVYVSSSPEPASLDALVDTTVQQLSTPAEEVTTAGLVDSYSDNQNVIAEPVASSPSPIVMDTSVQENKVTVDQPEQSVEIVHAQSMVEVVAPASPIHEPELQFVTSQPELVEAVATPSPVYTPAPLNDLMSTSMILEHPISDAPEQIEEMMKFIPIIPEVVYNNLEQQQTAEVVNIVSDERQVTPECANVLDADDSEQSYSATSPVHVVLCPEPITESLVGEIEQQSSVEPAMIPIEVAHSPVPSPHSAEDSLIEQMNRANINDSYSGIEEQIDNAPEHVVVSPIQEALPVQESQPATEYISPEPTVDAVLEVPVDHTPSPVQIDGITTPISDVAPTTPMKAPMINDRPISPIHTPKADVIVQDEEIISEIAAPVSDTEQSDVATENIPPVTAAPRSATAVPRTRPTSATSKTAPGTPRPSARTTPGARPAPGGAVRSTASAARTTAAKTTTTSTRTTPAARTTPTSRTTTPSTRTPLSSRTTPGSRSTSATSTSTTRTTTTPRTPLSSRTATPSATRTTPSNSATRTTPSTAGARPTPTSRTTRPATTPSSVKSTTTTTSHVTPSTSRTTSSRPTSAATTPTTTRRVAISRRPTTTSAKDSTDSQTIKASATTTTSSTTTTTARAPITRKPLYPGPTAKATTTTTSSSKTATTATDKKEIKNSTNKMLSTRTTTVSRTATSATTRTAANTAPTHKPLASRTTAATKRVGSTSTTKTTRTTTTTVSKSDLKTKTVGEKTPVISQNSEEKKEVTTPETNGEVKIAQEETCVEVQTKEDNEIVEVSGDLEVTSTTTAVTEQVLVNGDDMH